MDISLCLHLRLPLTCVYCDSASLTSTITNNHKYNYIRRESIVTTDLNKTDKQFRKQHFHTDCVINAIYQLLCFRNSYPHAVTVGIAQTHTMGTTPGLQSLCTTEKSLPGKETATQVLQWGRSLESLWRNLCAMNVILWLTNIIYIKYSGKFVESVCVW